PPRQRRHRRPAERHPAHLLDRPALAAHQRGVLRRVVVLAALRARETDLPRRLLERRARVDALCFHERIADRERQRIRFAQTDLDALPRPGRVLRELRETLVARLAEQTEESHRCSEVQIVDRTRSSLISTARYAAATRSYAEQNAGHQVGTPGSGMRW